MRCPRRDETGLYWPSKEDSWENRDGFRACSYCGSMHPEDFLKAARDGVELCPTDKSYKVYVELPNPRAGKPSIISKTSGPAFDRDGRPTRNDLRLWERIAGRYIRRVWGPAPAHIQAKFYFQHLCPAEREVFLDLLNREKLQLDYPGKFYVLPFFVRRTESGYILREQE